MVGDLTLGYTTGASKAVKLKMGSGKESGFEISADGTNTLTIANSYEKSVPLSLTPNKVSLLNNNYTVSNSEFYNGLVVVEADAGLWIKAGTAMRIMGGNIGIDIGVDNTGSKNRIFLAEDLTEPVTLTGIKDGTSDNDAVNLSQLNKKATIKLTYVEAAHLENVNSGRLYTDGLDTAEGKIYLIRPLSEYIGDSTIIGAIPLWYSPSAIFDLTPGIVADTNSTGKITIGFPLCVKKGNNLDIEKFLKGIYFITME